MRDWNALGRADRELVDDTLRVMSIAFIYLDGAKSIDEFAGHRGNMPYAWLLYSAPRGSVRREAALSGCGRYLSRIRQP